MPEHKKERYWSRYAQTYDDYAEYVVGKTLRQEIFNRLSEEREMGDVIEFGCGTGYFTKAMVKNAKHIHATDLSDEMLEVARLRLEEFQNVTIQKADCESTSYPPGSFEAVLMANVLHVIEDPLKALRESRRILKDGGLLIVVSYTDYYMSWFEKMGLGIRYLLTFGTPPPYGPKNFSPSGLRFTVECAGFQIEELLLIGDKPGALYLKGRKN
jgi:ABC-2 type transport system ATP-binding protein